MNIASHLLNQANALMRTLASVDDPDSLQLDGQGRCVATFDDWVVEFILDPDAACIGYATTLIALSEPPDRLLMQRMLQANARPDETGGAVLALDADAQTVLWLAQQSLAADPAFFQAAFESFLNRADAWMALLRAGGQVSASAASEPPPPGTPMIRG
ncbi:MAG: CesT family type III secretion system chaperone [Betaproteobacteria bacterium]|nr:CesT family type III secretion system chaperone [Betaproteobacteria bacterium]